MSRLLEIFGRAITVDAAELIWHWLDELNSRTSQFEASRIQQLNHIIRLIRDKKQDSADQHLRLYLFDHPSCVRGRLAAAAISIANSNLHAAIEELNSVYVRQPSNTIALYTLGHCYERLQKEAEAAEFYQDCLKFKNYLQLPRQRLAAIYLKNCQLERTIQEYQLLGQEYPDDISTLVILGHLYIAAADYGRAVEAFDKAILIHPDNFHSQDEEVDQLIRDGQLSEALEHLERLAVEQPERADVALKRADLLSILGAEPEAILQYQNAINICPDFLEATIKLGTHFLQMQRQRQAAQQFNRAAEINDQIVDAYIGLAIAQKLSQNTPGALTTLSLAAALQPNSSLLLAETAALQCKAVMQQRPLSCLDDNPSRLISAVIRCHQHQLTQRPQNAHLHYTFGTLLMSVDRLHDAITAFRNALRINPTYTRARNKLAICLFETNQKDQAIQELVGPECEQLHRDTLQLHYRTALLYCDTLKFASSLINLQHQLESNFACPDATVNISIVLQNLGLLDRAAAMWDNLWQTAGQAVNA